jgi:hypothetical protein
MNAGQAPISAGIDRSRALYERPQVAIDDEPTYRTVHTAVVNAFSPRQVRDFLASLERRNLRIRDFEEVLGAGKLGVNTAAEYHRLSPNDQGLIREQYLASLEQVELPLRDKFFKLYAYY